MPVTFLIHTAGVCVCMCVFVCSSDCNCCGMGAVNYWNKPLNHGQGPLWLQNGGQEKRDRGLENCFHHLGPGQIEEEAEKRGRSGRREGPIGGRSLRVWGSIWKATLCLALYCTPCCFNQWQACSQSLEQRRLFFIVSLLPPFFLLHYTLTFLTKSPKSCTPLSSLHRSQEIWPAAAIKESFSMELNASVY